MKDLPEDAVWATAPLLDRSNVDKYVWRRRNQRASVVPIILVGRTNLHLGGNRDLSARVDPDGQTASGTEQGQNVQVYTEAYRVADSERIALQRTINNTRLHELSTETLRAIVALIERNR